MYDMSEVAKRIRLQLRQKKGNMKDMLNACGMSINTVSQLDSGTVISSVRLAKIADYLDCSVDYLLGRTDNPDVNR